MARYDGGWPAYVSIGERRAKAEREARKMSKKGAVLSPVVVEGRKIANTFWGAAWCDNLESYRDYENRLERGRSYVRNGLVIDLQIAPHLVTAIVSGSSMYTVKITIGEVPKAQWKSICADCAGGIDSLVELLQGRFSKGVMERICRQGVGLFPKPSEIRFSCSCLDYASMCKHVAAALYGVGARLDAKPELLFRLRAVDENDLVANIGEALPMAKQAPAAGKVLEADDMAVLFGLDMGDMTDPGAIAEPVVPAKVAAVQPKAALRAKPNVGAKPADRANQQPVLNQAVAKLSTDKKVGRVSTAMAGKAEPKVVAGKAEPKVVAGKAEPKPVEWWKPGTATPAGKRLAAKVVTAQPAERRKVRAAS